MIVRMRRGAAAEGVSAGEAETKPPVRRHNGARRTGGALRPVPLLPSERELAAALVSIARDPGGRHDPYVTHPARADDGQPRAGVVEGLSTT